MRFIAFALLAIASTSAEAGKKICEPGSHKKVDCNTCMCSKEGTAWGCTFMLCSDDDSSVVAAQSSLARQVCEPDSTMNEGCNICYCLGDGSGYVCTDHNCPSASRSVEEAPKQVCEPGKTKKEQCNNCFCIGDGSAWACTDMACPEYFNEDGSLKLPHEIENNPLLRVDGVTCEPGKEFKDYCNTCFCGIDGKSAGCTKMGCPFGLYNKDGSLRFPWSDNPLLRGQDKSDQSCEPGKSFKYYCNTCACGPNGKKYEAACTRKACTPGIYNEDGTFRNPNANNPLLRGQDQYNDNCKPGESYNYLCNKCACGPDGKKSKGVCTKMYCPPGIYNEDGTFKNPNANNPLLRERRESDESCEPGQEFSNFCNTCACGEDGKKATAVCTLVYCPPGLYNEDGTMNIPTLTSSNDKAPTVRNCQPGKTFKDDCNTCVCSDDGKTASCTAMACGNSRTERSVTEARKVCKPGKYYKDECNDCVCNEDGTKASCTLGFCLPAPLRAKYSEFVPNPPKVCDPGKYFKQGCNDCYCNDDGTHARCTLKYCPAEVESRQERSLGFVEPSDQFCTPGETFKQDCSSCTCGVDGTSAFCNLQFCYARAATIAKSNDKLCEPGETYDDGCNTCFCNKDGTHAACTLKLCLPKLLRKNGKKVCEPGRSFKRDCNFCMCNRDGTDAACTLMLCPPKLERTERSARICEPGKTFKDDCNTCNCNKYGTEAACTMMLCPPKLERSKRSAKICEPGESFKQDCNTCTCNEFGTGAACTLMGCLH